MAVVHFMLGRGLFFHPVELAYAPSLFGPLAQSVEQLAFNQLVAGSNPARPTIKANHPRVVFFKIYLDDAACQ